MENNSIKYHTSISTQNWVAITATTTSTITTTP
ncbi:hypothetical protein SAMN06265346_1036 [Flavobacterium hercynium]|nr:hypothetical protein SAMN06265346_1036 [Flavobacterium hercynium]